MPRSHKGHKYMLYITDEVNNYLITVPIYQAKSEEIGEVLIENVITKYCIPEYIIMDQDSSLCIAEPSSGSQKQNQRFWFLRS